MTTITKVLELGRVDYNDTGYRTHPVTIELNLRPAQGTDRRTIDLEPRPDDAVSLSIVGNVWTKSRNDTVCCGQITNEIRRLFPDDSRIQKICDVWDRWHLNDMKSGTRLQQNCIDDYKASLFQCTDILWRYDYATACDVLRQNALYEDRGYKYGHEWLHEIIPGDVLDGVKQLFDIPNTI